MSGTPGSFSEKDFYLAEFRGRTLGIALPDGAPGDAPGLAPVLDDLADNDTRVVCFVPASRGPVTGAGSTVDRADGPEWIGRLWRLLARERRAAVALPDEGFAAACRAAAVRLRLAKLVWIDPGGALRDATGRRVSALALPDLADRLDELAGEARAGVPLEEIPALLASGITSVSVCRLEELAAELFTYAGSGTFFSRERYADVRALTLDDFDAAARLIAQGVAEGYLAPRTDAEVESLLSHGFGVFIEGRYLAGVGALRPYAEAACGEIAGLYTVTRFAGEGVGGHLIRFALARAGAVGLRRVFACTTADRVAGFFLRHGFERVGPDRIPSRKWADYPPERREKLHCVERAVDDASTLDGAGR